MSLYFEKCVVISKAILKEEIDDASLVIFKGLATDVRFSLLQNDLIGSPICGTAIRP